MQRHISWTLELLTEMPSVFYQHFYICLSTYFDLSTLAIRASLTTCLNFRRLAKPRTNVVRVHSKAVGSGTENR